MDTFTPISFNNRQNPASDFDVIRLEELRGRTYSDHSPMDFHRVQFYIIMLVEAGQFSHFLDFTPVVCQPGTIVTIRKDQVHRFSLTEDARGELLLFTREFLVSFLSEAEALRAMQVFNGFLASPWVRPDSDVWNRVLGSVERIRHEYLNVWDEYSRVVIRNELQILIILLLRQKYASQPLDYLDRRVRTFIRFQEMVEEQVHITRKVADYALQLGVSPKTLNHAVHRMVRKSAKELIVEIGILRLKRLLINTDLSVKEIAYSSGFSDATNVYKFFRNATGETPESFRSLNR